MRNNIKVGYDDSGGLPRCGGDDKGGIANDAENADDTGGDNNASNTLDTATGVTLDFSPNQNNAEETNDNKCGLNDVIDDASEELAPNILDNGEPMNKNHELEDVIEVAVKELADANDKNGKGLNSATGDAFQTFQNHTENDGKLSSFSDDGLKSATGDAFVELPNTNNDVSDARSEDAIEESLKARPVNIRNLDRYNENVHEEGIDSAMGDTFKELHSNDKANDKYNDNEDELKGVTGDDFNSVTKDEEDFKDDLSQFDDFNDDELNDVIDDAFKKLTPGNENVDTAKSVNTKFESDDGLSETIGDAFKHLAPEYKNVHEIKSGQSDNHSDNGVDDVNQAQINKHIVDDDDIDLESAIGSAFKTFNENLITNTSEKVEVVPQRINENDRIEGEIGDDFKKTVPSDTNSNDSTVNGHIEETINTIDDNVVHRFENAIGGPLKDVTPIHLGETIAGTNRQKETNDQSKDSFEETFESHVIEDHDDDGLEAAIGDAFKEFGNNKSIDSPGNDDLNDNIYDTFDQPKIRHESNEISNNAVGNVFSELNPVKPTSTSGNALEGPTDKLSDDEELDEAIGKAFNNIFESNKPGNNDFEEQSDDELNTAIGDALKNIPTVSHNNKQENIQASNQAHTNSEGNTLDDNELNQLISASFHKLINNDNQQQNEKDQDDDGNMEDAIAQAFKSAMNDESKSNHQNESYQNFQNQATSEMSYGSRELLPTSSNKTHSSSDDKEKILELLEVRNILQNAFKMATERPTESIDNDPGHTSVDSKSCSSVPITLAEKLASTLSNYPSSITESTTEFLESLKQSSRNWDKDNDINLLESPIRVTEKHQELTKDDHEQSTLASRLLLDTNATSQMSPQLLDVIGSITSRIAKSGMTTASDANILGIIRSMRDAFSTNLTDLTILSSNIPSTAELISSFKSDEEKLAFFRSLTLAKSYIEYENVTDSFKLKELIDSVLHRFNIYSSFSSNNEILVGVNDSLFRIISEMKNSIISIIGSSAPTSKSRSDSSPTEIFRTDSMEYREKIRVENRVRKKRWRTGNSEKNKDNDLRVRVTKRAVAMFGVTESKSKSLWIEKEFQRRKDRRLARLKKDDSDSKDERLTDESDIFAKDSSLIKSITGIFNMFTSYTYQEDAEVVLLTSSIVTASAAAVYSINNPTFDAGLIIIAVEIIFANLMNEFKISNKLDRITTLAQAIKLTHFSEISTENDSHQIPEITDAEFSSIMTGNIGMSKNYSSDASSVFADDMSNFDASENTTLKPISLEDDDSGSNINLTLKRNFEEDSMLDRTYLRNDISANSHWEQSSKVPPYKKPQIFKASAPSVSYPTLTLPTTSPYISNKLNFGNLSRKLVGSGLRKPGSFQKPPHITKPNTNLFGSHQYN